MGLGGRSQDCWAHNVRLVRSGSVLLPAWQLHISCHPTSSRQVTYLELCLPSEFVKEKCYFSASFILHVGGRQRKKTRGLWPYCQFIFLNPLPCEHFQNLLLLLLNISHAATAVYWHDSQFLLSNGESVQNTLRLLLLQKQWTVAKITAANMSSDSGTFFCTSAFQKMTFIRCKAYKYVLTV